MMARLLLGAVLALAVVPAQAEIPEVEAAASNLWVKRPPPRADEPDLVLKDRHGRVKPTRNRSAGVPGTLVTVQFPPGSAELDEAQKLALYKLTREWRFTRGVQLLWVRAGGDGDNAALARKRAEALRRATGGKGFPWKKVFLDPAWGECGGDDCAAVNAQGTITVIEAR
jgi:outer membrane protein OmpA-like peptidoglycan-associated protein